MKILQIVGYTSGGIGAYVNTLTEDLIDQGNSVRIMCPESVATTFNIKKPIIAWPNIGFTWTKIRSTATAIATFRKMISMSDVVHIHGNQAALFALLVAKRSDHKKIIVTLHNKIILTGFKQIVSRYARKFVARTAYSVSAVSTDLVEEAQADGAKNTFIAPVFAPRVTQLLAKEVSSRAVRQLNFSSLVSKLPVEEQTYFDTSKPLVLSVCRIAPQKAIEDIVSIANAYKDANFVVIGDGVDSLLEKLRKQDQGNRVFFALRRNDIAQWLDAATVMLLTSKWEGCPLALQEAMANGLPIVSTFGGGIPDLVYDAKTGYKGGILCNVADWENMQLCVEQIVNDSSLWYKFSTEGRKIARTWKNNTQIAQFWLDKYKDMR